MGQSQKKDVLRPEKANKIHKTLREKLRKRRELQKLRKKQKSEQKKQYNPEQEKLKFFSRAQNKQDNYKQIRQKKISKYIEEFINIYEDDLDEFYQMFKTLDDGGFIDISQLANKKLIKCLEQLFSYLPLKVQKGQYFKIKTSQINLEKFMKQKVSFAIQNYLQNGSNDQFQSSSAQEIMKIQKKTKKNHKKIVPKIQETDQDYEKLKLYKQTYHEIESIDKKQISEIQRRKINQILQRQLANVQKVKQQNILQQEKQIFQIQQNGSTIKQAIFTPKNTIFKINYNKNQQNQQEKSSKLINNNNPNKEAKIEQAIQVNKQVIQQKLKQYSSTHKCLNGHSQKLKGSFFNFNNKQFNNLLGNNQLI